MLDQLLGSVKGNVLNDLTSKLGLSGDQAGGFLQKALGLVQAAIAGGKLDAASLLNGNLSGVMSKLDVSSLAGLVGGDGGKAKTGMESVLGGLMSSIKSNPDAGAMLGQLTGGGGGVMGKFSGLAGSLFGKK